ncbi:MAG: penicillin acylase family protein, partial [Chlorobiales bacterium]|nr:penicillin acylase family protein [Chlorobiales bacterium]
PQQGWLVTANHRPIASFYPFYQGNSTGSLGDTDRSWRLKERVLAQDSFKPEDVLAIHYDQVSPVKRDIVRFGLFLRDQQAHPLQRDTLLALKHLEPWLAAGAESDLRIKGTALVNAMSIMFRANFAASTIYGGGGSGLVNMMQTINQRLAEEPHAVLSSYEVEFVDLTLQQAWRNAQSQYGRDPNTWLDQANAKLKRSQLPYFATLDGFGSLDTEKDISMPGLRCIEGGTILSQKAQAYTQYVPLDNPDQAQTILPPGQSEHPDSPSHLCTYKLWENAQLHPAPLSRQAVERLKVISAYP